MRDRVVIATKFMPSPWKLNVHSALLASARKSRERLGIESIDLYQIHGPISLRSHDALADALAAAQAEGLVKAVGVSNYSTKETRSIDAALRRAACAWPATRSSSRCCARCRSASGSSIAAASSASCRWRTRRSARAG